MHATYEQFRKKARAFVTVCRGLSETRSKKPNDTTSDVLGSFFGGGKVEWFGFEPLIMKLDMNGWCERRAGTTR